MVNIIEKKLDIEEGAKKKFEFIGSFTGYKPRFINGSIRNILIKQILAILNLIELFIKV